MHIKCYHPPVNITHLEDWILVPEEDVFNYTKELYEKGLEHKAIPPQQEIELQEFFRWKVRYKSSNRFIKWLVDMLIS